MKIKCEFCENMIDDTNSVCPNCGAPNKNVVRSTKSQPTTIAELKLWYSDRGLPPYEVTRFFIDTDYKGARAFGIYKDSSTGNFIVYKNKDSGARAVRYEGTDEAYAVNELFMRLKQEIIEQKQAASGNGSKSDASNYGSASLIERGLDIFGMMVRGVFTMLSILFGFMVLTSYFASLGLSNPEEGYYNYEGNPYYYFDDAKCWYGFDSAAAQWNNRAMDEGSIPDQLSTKKKSKPYFLGKYWKPEYGMPDFTESTALDDYYNSTIDTGYYSYNGSSFYNLTGNLDDGWFSYDDSDSTWSKVDYEALPEDLTHSATVSDFYDTNTWDSSLQISDFEDSPAYEEYQEENYYSDSSYSESDDSWFGSSDDSYYDWGSDDSWDSGGSDWDSDW